MAGDPAAARSRPRSTATIRCSRTQYDKLLTDREQVKLRSQAQSQTDAVKFNVIDPPTAPRAPTAPNRPLLLTGVLIVGLGGGRRRRRSALGQLADDLPDRRRGWKRRAGMPVIGSIGEVVTAAQIALAQEAAANVRGGDGRRLAFAWVALLGLEIFQRGTMA